MTAQTASQPTPARCTPLSSLLFCYLQFSPHAHMCRADETTKIHGGLSDWLLADGGSQNDYPTAFNFAFKTQGKFYEWLETPGNEKRLGRFGHAMNGTRYWEVTENIVHGACVPRVSRPLPDSDSNFDFGSTSTSSSSAAARTRFGYFEPPCAWEELIEDWVICRFPLGRASAGRGCSRRGRRDRLRVCSSRGRVPAFALRGQGSGFGRCHCSAGAYPVVPGTVPI